MGRDGADKIEANEEQEEILPRRDILPSYCTAALDRLA